MLEVEFARRYNVPLHVRSSFSELDGTIVRNPTEEDPMEEPIIAGVAHDRSQGKVTIVGVKDIPGSASRVFSVLAGAEANIDMIVQNPPTDRQGVTDISFTAPKEGIPALVAALEAHRAEIGFEEIQHIENVGIVSLVGAGMRTNTGVSATLFGALSDAGINIEMISTSEIRISVVTLPEKLDDAVRAIHSAFDLDSQDVNLFCIL